MSYYITFAIGLLAQLLFSSRLIIQWLRSEKAHKVVSPTIFWQLSLVASFLLMVYGILRNDMVIILGQLLSYFIYIRNLQYKNAWKFIPLIFKLLVVIFPMVAMIWLLSDGEHNWLAMINNENISGVMLTWGSVGQVVFTGRFVYQWYFSEKNKVSVLPGGFWVISIVGSVMIMAYGIYRRDPILILGQIFGFFIYSRNLFIMIRNGRIAFKKMSHD